MRRWRFPKRQTDWIVTSDETLRIVPADLTG